MSEDESKFDAELFKQALEGEVALVENIKELIADKAWRLATHTLR